MNAPESLCPVVARETVEMERKEGRKWVRFFVDILWLRETFARNDYIELGTRNSEPGMKGTPFSDHWGFGKSVSVAVAVATKTSKDYMLSELRPGLEMVVRARSHEVPLLADIGPATINLSFPPPGRGRYQEVPSEWRVRSTRKPMGPVERTPERIVWSSRALPEENLLTVKAFLAEEMPPSIPETASHPSTASLRA